MYQPTLSADDLFRLPSQPTDCWDETGEIGETLTLRFVSEPDPAIRAWISSLGETISTDEAEDRSITITVRPTPPVEPEEKVDDLEATDEAEAASTSLDVIAGGAGVDQVTETVANFLTLSDLRHWRATTSGVRDSPIVTAATTRKVTAYSTPYAAVTRFDNPVPTDEIVELTGVGHSYLINAAKFPLLERVRFPSKRLVVASRLRGRVSGYQTVFPWLEWCHAPISITSISDLAIDLMTVCGCMNMRNFTLPVESLTVRMLGRVPAGFGETGFGFLSPELRALTMPLSIAERSQLSTDVVSLTLLGIVADVEALGRVLAKLPKLTDLTVTLLHTSQLAAFEALFAGEVSTLVTIRVAFASGTVGDGTMVDPRMEMIDWKSEPTPWEIVSALETPPPPPPMVTQMVTQMVFTPLIGSL